MELSDKITSLDMLMAAKDPVSGRPLGRLLRSGLSYELTPASTGSGLPVIVFKRDGDDPEFSPCPRFNTGIHVPKEMWWAVRESLRLDRGVYPEGSVVTNWLCRRNGTTGHPTNHFVHVSKEDPSLIAFTADPEAGAQDKQVRMALGRYLKRYMSLPDADIQRLEAAHRADLSSDISFTTEISAAYMRAHDGCSSCMTHPASYYGDTGGHHPMEVLDNMPGWRLAYLERDGRIIARAMTWTNPDDPLDKRAIRVYGDAALRRRLLRQGFAFKPAYGAKLRVIRVDQGTRHRDYGRVLAPYMDGIDGVQSDGTVHVVWADDALTMVTAEAAAVMTRAARDAGVSFDGHVLTSSFKSTGGTQNLVRVSSELFSYTCAIDGQVYNRTTHPACHVLLTADGSIQLARQAAVDTWPRVLTVDSQHRSLTSVSVPDTMPTFAGASGTFVDNEASRGFNGFVKLDAEWYPEDRDWRRNDQGVVGVTDGDRLRYALREDTVLLVLAEDPVKFPRRHKSQIPAGATRVADIAQTKVFAEAGVNIVLTDTGRKVVPGAHEVVKLYGTQTWVYERKAIAARFAGHRGFVLRAGAVYHPAREAPLLELTADTVDDMMSNFASWSAHAAEHAMHTAKNWVSSMVGKYQDTNIWSLRSRYGSVETGGWAELLTLPPNCTAQDVLSQSPATRADVAPVVALMARNAHRMQAVFAPVEARLQAERAALEFVRAAALAGAPVPYTPVSREEVTDHDRVVVMRRWRGSDVEGRVWRNAWVEDMDAFLGEVSDNRGLYESAPSDSLYVGRAASGRYTFPRECVATYDEAVRAAKAAMADLNAAALAVADAPAAAQESIEPADAPAAAQESIEPADAPAAAQESTESAGAAD